MGALKGKMNFFIKNLSELRFVDATGMQVDTPGTKDVHNGSDTNLK